jgi:hypothetical protein
MKLWIVEKIRNALNITQDYKNLKQDLEHQFEIFSINQKQNVSMIVQLDKELDFFKEMCEVGVDVHRKHIR